jgi:hypothetical protein
MWKWETAKTNPNKTHIDCEKTWLDWIFRTTPITPADTTVPYKSSSTGMINANKGSGEDHFPINPLSLSHVFRKFRWIHYVYCMVENLVYSILFYWLVSPHMGCAPEANLCGLATSRHRMIQNRGIDRVLRLEMEQQWETHWSLPKLAYKPIEVIYHFSCRSANPIYNSYIRIIRILQGCNWRGPKLGDAPKCP